MATRKVPGNYPTISAAIAAAAAGDIIAVAAAYTGNETVDVAVDNLTVSGPPAVVGIVLNLGAGVQRITLAGGAPITVNGGNDSNIILDTGKGSNVLNGGAGDDTITSNGNDIVNGGAGNDTLVDIADSFGTLAGGDGDDLFRISSTARGGAIDGGAGIDTVQAYDLGKVTFANVEILDGYSNPGFTGTVGQFAAFGTITASQAAVNSRLAFSLTGTGGTLDLSGRVGGKRSVSVNASLAKGVVDITGTGNADSLVGSAYSDTLSGGAGNDTLDGGLGSNVLDGGDGNDTIQSSGNDVGDGGAGNDTIIVGLGLHTTKTLKGGDGNDLFQFAYNDGGKAAIDGGAGIDTLQGLYDVSALTLANVEIFDGYSTGQGGGGIRGTVAQVASFTTITDSLRPANSQFSIVLSGAGGTLDLSNKLAGKRSVSIWDDGLKGSINVTGTAYGDYLVGSRYADTLNGGAGDDTIDGGMGGNDTLIGGDGNDTVNYVYLSDHVLSAGVTVSLAVTGPQNTGSGRTDTLIGFENLTGSAYSDVLIGDSGNNVLDGGAGYDVLEGGAGADTLIGGGDATIDPYWWRNAASYAHATAGVVASLTKPATNTGDAAGDKYMMISDLAGSSFDDVLIGDGGSNTLMGGGGDDLLNGMGAVDRFEGGGGNDTVTFVDSTVAVQTSLSGDGSEYDNSYSSIENLTGSRYGDVLTGDANDNSLRGGGGKDTLTGGAGSDRFIFDQTLVPANLMTVTDFAPGSDSIVLSLGVFTKAGAAAGGLVAQAFFIGAVAHDASDRIIYNSSNGNLMYDSDGTGSNAAVTFARLGAHLLLTNNDFQLF